MRTLDADLMTLQEMRDAVDHAYEAQLVYSSFSQKQVDLIVREVAEAAYEQAERLAQMAVEETGMGVVEHKRLKNELGSRGVYESIKDKKTIGIIRKDEQLKVTEIAYPFGVIAAITPTTNPTSTAIFKTLISLKTGNGIVFSPHPSAATCTIEALKICRAAAERAGAPSGLIGWITRPTMEATSQLMKHNHIQLLLATGGSGLVRAAYSSGKPAFGVGPGNGPAYIDKTANVEQAVKRIIDSKTFDNGTLCSSEQAIVVHETVKEQVIVALQKYGGYLVSTEEKRKLEQVISPLKGSLNPNIVGKSAEWIAKLAGVTIPVGTRLLVASEARVGKEVPFSIEKLAPLISFYTVGGVEEAKKLCTDLLNLGGRGHSCSIHTNDERVVESFGLALPVSRMLVNTLASIGAAGATTGLDPSLTLGCGAYGGNMTSDNITARHLINIKRIAYGIREVELQNDDERDQLTVMIDHIIGKVGQVKAADQETVASIVKQVIDQYKK